MTVARRRAVVAVGRSARAAVRMAAVQAVLACVDGWSALRPGGGAA